MRKILAMVAIILIAAESVYLVYIHRRLKILGNSEQVSQNMTESPSQNLFLSANPNSSQTPVAADKTPFKTNSYTSTDFLKELEEWGKWEAPPTEENLAEHARKLKNDPEDAETHFLAARIHFFFKQYEKTIEHFREILRLSPDHSRKQMMEWCLGEWEAAQPRRDISQGIQKQLEIVCDSPSNSKEYVKLARLYRSQAMNEAARSWYKKSLGCDRENPGLILEVALFIENDYYPESVELFREILKLRPEYSRKSEILQHISSVERKMREQSALYEEEASEENLLSALKIQIGRDSKIQRKNAVERLATIKTENSTTILQECLLDMEKKELHRDAATALRRMDTVESMDSLRKMLYRLDLPVHLKVDILLACRQYGDERDIRMIGQWLEDESSQSCRVQAQWVTEELQKSRIGIGGEGEQP